MAQPGTVTGWKLPRDERDNLLARFPPKYQNVVADHVTLRVGAAPETPLPRQPDEARVANRRSAALSNPVLTNAGRHHADVAWFESQPGKCLFPLIGARHHHGVAMNKGGESLQQVEDWY